ncbi:MAG: diguanylate cyclase [Gammaproteobacteria bacterium]
MNRTFLMILIVAFSLPFSAMAETLTHSSPGQMLNGRSANADQKKIVLTPEEKEFLKPIRSITMCVDPDWLPYDQINAEGRHIGINADFQKLFARYIGKEIQLIQTNSWAQSLEYIKARKCDILSSAQVTKERQQYLAFTRPFMRYPIVIATRSDQMFIQDISTVVTLPLAMVKGYAVIEMLRQQYPCIKIIEVDNAATGLEMVANGKAFGYIDTVATIAYQTQKHGILNIKISGITDKHYDMSVAVRNDRPQLLGVFNKAVASITETERLDILNKWIAIKYEQKTDYTLIGKISLAIAFIFSFILYRQRLINQYNARLKALNQELEHLSKTDPLTGVANRHLLNHTFQEELERVHRYRSNLSIIMIDVDYFKTINDRFGHIIGDQVLKKLADLMSSTIRSTDLIGRWGGEEFLILCPETDLNGAIKLAENIRQNISHYNFGIPQTITVSQGVAEYQKMQSLEKFINCADNALYKAKEAGRNSVIAGTV